ncbi:FKBP-type peptidyl-prolyl cis-trans isomerase, partial [Citrobacter farmeri]|nr:FKBP-type peptidyl-prolyl cis-trans isomerase [Citrobacter farmeri]
KNSLTDSQNQGAALNEQIAALTAEQTANARALAEAKAGDSNAVTELKQTLSKSQAESAALKNSLTDSQNQGAALNKQIAALTAEQTANVKALAEAKAGDSNVVAELKQALEKSRAELVTLKNSLTDSQNQGAALNRQIAELTAAQTANVKALAEAKAGDSNVVAELKQALEKSRAELVTLKNSLTDSQNQGIALNKQVAELTAEQTANARALVEAKAGDSTAVAELKQAMDKSQNETAKLKQSLNDSQNQVAEQVKQITDLRTSLGDNDKSLADAREMLAKNKTQQDEAQKKLLEATAKLDAQNKQIATLSTTKAGATTPAPVSEEQLRSYALGTLWGQEVRGAMANVQTDGFLLELTQVISGVSDSIKGQYKVPESKLMAELDVMNKKAMERQKSASAKADKSNNFISTFSSKPGTKRADMGYYYRITQKGRGKIAPTDEVAIAVKESLSNGKVIKDMAKSGKLLVLPLANFPPLFNSAISKMNKGSKLIMAVPPELAYGEQGRPPEIPPSSTMVYEITVVDVRPAAGR